jgi:O-antigen chain-terminating methyltransferase
VTGFHIVEHLPLDDLLALLDETNRVLRPGGMAIFETPNPSNLQVSTENFYLDPTHRNPLPKALLKFLVESRGLCDIEVLPLHPYPASHRLEDDGRAATRLLNELLFSEQDYAVIGRKA